MACPIYVVKRILHSIGVEIHELGPHSIALQARDIRQTTLDPNLCREIRASILFAGPMLARSHQI